MKKIALQTRLRMQCDTFFGILIFPSDGTDRIRFTGQSQQAHSQPDASGPPKTYLLSVADIIPILAKNVKRKRKCRMQNDEYKIAVSALRTI